MSVKDQVCTTLLTDSVSSARYLELVPVNLILPTQHFRQLSRDSQRQNQNPLMYAAKYTDMRNAGISTTQLHQQDGRKI